MANRPQIKPIRVITDGDMSAASLTSRVTIIQDLTFVAYAFSWSGSSPVGTIAIQVSSDYTQDSSGNAQNAGTWNTLTLNYNGAAVTSISVSGNTGNGYINLTQLSAYAIRAVYTKTSGTGTLQAYVNAKVA